MYKRSSVRLVVGFSSEIIKVRKQCGVLFKAPKVKVRMQQRIPYPLQYLSKIEY